MKFDSIETILEELRQGRMVIVVDDEDRENEGDLVIPAEKATPEHINFMATHGRGLICLAMTGERLDELQLPLMVDTNTDTMGTAFTVSVDAKETTTGISAYERAMTVRKMIDPATKPDDLRKPGHIFPLRAKEGGALVRPGHTEAAVDLARLAGLYPAGVICEVMAPDGTMARVPQLMEFASKHNLKITTIAALIRYRQGRELNVRRVAEANLPTEYGAFRIIGYEDESTGESHVALVKGQVAGKENVLVRLHSECLTGDVFRSKRCDCGEQYAAAMRQIEREGCGVLLYLRQEGRGIGLLNKLRAYALQEQGYDTVEANEMLGFPADMREYGSAAKMLYDLGIKSVRLLTNNPRKIKGLEKWGVTVSERVPLEMKVKPENRRYLETKKRKLGHMLRGA